MHLYVEHTKICMLQKKITAKKKSARPNIPTTLIITINKTLFDKINDKIALDGKYAFKGFVELEKTDSTVFNKDIVVNYAVIFFQMS